MSAPPLRTRKPTGLPSWPMILLEGVEKSGKSYSAAELSVSKQVGRTFWFDLGEGAGDEYGALPGARYEVVEHDGTYGDFCGQIAAAMAVPMEDGLPNVIVVDSITALWSLLVDEAGATTLARKKTDVTMDLWNIAKKKWRWVMDRLMAYDGIVVLLARGKEVAVVEGGRPINGKTQWKVEGEKSLAYDATAWVRMVEPRKAELAGIRSLVLRIPEGRSTLPLPGFTLDRLIFEQMGLASATTQRRDYRPATAGYTPAPAESSGEGGKTERSTGQQDDPWSTAAPSPASPEWLASITARIAEATDAGVLRGLFAEVTTQHKAGGCTNEQRLEMQGVLSERADELKQGAPPEDAA